jgi:DNA mismatch repair ATPase MutS
LRRKIWEKLSQTHEAINMIRSIRAQVQEWQRRTKGQKDYEAITNAAKPVLEKLPPIEEELIQVKAKTRQDTLNHPAKLNAKLAALGGTVASALAAPTQQEYQLFDDLSRQVDEQIKRLQEVIDTDVAAFNSAVKEVGVAAVIPSTEM